MALSKQLTSDLHQLFIEYAENDYALDMISLATTDGFPVHHFSRLHDELDIETMAAAASTLYSVSNAVAKQILSKQFKITFIESEQGNIAFVSLKINDQDFVLSMSASNAMNIANLRLLINRLATKICTLDLPNIA
ncbi:Uncharacterised protein [Zhongshania aliphaticivorans]|uniref:Roadblock/LAMTOR2 domain-containing protein n=1 Tax=Zhongshania aliphaticivorans TaxID=1470434 RepID=A0A5S9NQ30_9GAMM|nr:roadblock/LC7 domain-containing protein [Zhongshania aliphaticivorans]CAA0092564.1 Uncharacterised protein [Zhongshania aliphaticivorans]CAA0109877.1 Uncharacterised protein [Zhongshania aliphaticivorans]